MSSGPGHCLQRACDLLRRERLDLHQRELLLDTVIQTTPLVLVLTNSAGRIVYSNIAAASSFMAAAKARRVGTS